MKTIRNATIYECDWCARRSLTQTACKQHEKQCDDNPNKIAPASVKLPEPSPIRKEPNRF